MLQKWPKSFFFFSPDMENRIALRQKQQRTRKTHRLKEKCECKEMLRKDDEELFMFKVCIYLCGCVSLNAHRNDRSVKCNIR